MFSYEIDQATIEKKQIRRAANCIGAAYAFIFLPRWLLEFFVRRSSGFALFIYNVANSVAYSAVFDMCVSILVLIFPYMLFCRVAGRSLQVADFRKPKNGFLPLLLMGIGLCQIGEVLNALFANAISIFGEGSGGSHTFFDRSFYGVAFSVISVAVIPALCEEFAMRGIVLGVLRRHGEGFALIVSSLMFGAMHLNLTQAPFAFIVGLGLGFIAIKSGSVFTAVLVHFINNLTYVLFAYLAESGGYFTNSLVFCCYAVAVLALGIIGLMLYRDKKELFSLSRGEGVLSLPAKFGAFLSSPTIIAALVVTVIEIFKNQIG